MPFVEQLQALKKLVDQGKVRHIGVSNETPYGVCQFIKEHERDASLPRICSIQNSYSLLVRSDFESGLTETCAQTNVGLLAYSPLAGGILSGKYSGSKAPAGALLPEYLPERMPPANGEYARSPTFVWAHVSVRPLSKSDRTSKE